MRSAFSEKIKAYSQEAITSSKLSIETLEKSLKYVNFEHILRLFLEFLLLTWNKLLLAGCLQIFSCQKSEPIFGMIHCLPSASTF